MPARFLIAFFFGGALIAAGMAPLLAGNGRTLAASILYLLLAPVCHQMPERSFVLLSHGWGLCHRCCGLYLGILLAAVLTIVPWLESKALRYRRPWAIGATAIVAGDALLPYVSLWTNTPFSRFTTGLVFGIMLGSLLVRAIAELLARWQYRRRCSFLPDTLGGVS